MFRFFAFCALVCLCVLAEETFTPPEFECAFHFTVTTKSNEKKKSTPTTEYFGFWKDEKSLLKVIDNDQGSYTLVRCDKKDEQGACYKKTQSLTDDSSCEDDRYVDFDEIKELAYSSFPEELDYDDEEYPVDAECPDGTNDCEKYCDDFICITVDEDGFIVKISDDQTVTTITYEAAPTADVFDDKACDDTSLPTATDPCGENPSSGGSGGSGKMFDSKLDCAFHATTEDDSGAIVEYLGLINDDGQYLKIIDEEEEEVTLIRCDDKNEEGCYKQVSDDPEDPDPDTCEDEERESDIYSYLQYIHVSFDYDKDLYPQASVCPDGSDGCSFYESSDGIEYIVDGNNRVVSADEMIITYGPPPSVDEFKGVTCSGDDLDAPTNPCKADPSSSSHAPSSSHSSAVPHTSSSSTTPSASYSSGASSSASSSSASNLSLSSSNVTSVEPSISSASVSRVAISVALVVMLIALV